MNQQAAGTLTRIAGPVVHAQIADQLAMLEQVWVGELQLTGEVVALHHDLATIQVYEETSGLRPGEPLYRSRRPLSVDLGPGLLGSIYDGIQRPLRLMYSQSGIYIQRGARAAALPDRHWHFVPSVQENAAAQGGVLVGTVAETTLIEHRVLVPPDRQGVFAEIAPEGDYLPRRRNCTYHGRERPAVHADADPDMACSPAAAVHNTAGAGSAAHHRPARARHVLCYRQGGDGGHTRSFWRR